MIVTTTPAIEGRPVQQYLGIVTGEVIVGANLVRDLFAAVTDIVGGRSGKYEQVLQRAREEAIAEMQDNALKLGGNAVIGVDLDVLIREDRRDPRLEHRRAIEEEGRADGTSHRPDHHGSCRARAQHHRAPLMASQMAVQMPPSSTGT